jgi:predicted PurR-regulated permease PerM
MNLSEEDHKYVSRATEAAIRIGLLAALVMLCFQIVRPFALPVVWGVIIAVAIYPLYERLVKRLGGRRKLAAALFILVTLGLLLVPTVMFLGSVTETLIHIAKGLSAGTLTLPACPEGIANLPVVGDNIEAAWKGAIADTPGFYQQHDAQVAGVASWILSTAAGLVFGVLAFAFSVVIGGVMMATAAGGSKAAESIGLQLAGARGVDLVRVSAATIHSVAVGVVGVALIQALLAAVGMVVAGVPAAGVWALVILVLAIAQMPPLFVLGPMIFYVFSTTNTTGAVIFMIWALLIGVSDGFLKPLLMGRGVKVPMLVILIGAIGGMLAMGILGLFVGAVILAVGQQVYVAWAKAGTPGEDGDETAEPATAG